VKRKLIMWAAVVFCVGGFFAGSVALADVINGTDGDDTLEGTNVSDSIFGYGGNDTIYGFGGQDELWGSFGADTLYGGGANDTMHGEGGNDALFGGPNDDELRGGDGVDVLTGHGGDDRFYDSNGNAAERDRFNCGAGNDTVHQADPTDSLAPSCENVPTGGEDLLPDLAMAPLQNLRIRNCTDPSQRDCAYVGQRQLRFDAVIVNVGADSFEAHGERPDTSTSPTVTQRIFNDAGGYRDIPTTAQMYFAGDGHNHWRLRDLESYELIRLDNGTKVGTGDKEGFCFFDNFVYGSTQDAFYKGCGRDLDALQVEMGLSRGWGDRYGAGTVGQYIDITNLTSGRYKLQATADEPNWFLESDDSNNFSWVEIQLSGNSVSVIAYGPSAGPISD
jgi:hypothetical protein